MYSVHGAYALAICLHFFNTAEDKQTLRFESKRLMLICSAHTLRVFLEENEKQAFELIAYDNQIMHK